MESSRLCGICGLPGADTPIKARFGLPYWPGELFPLASHVHKDCERSETLRAYEALSDVEREDFIENLILDGGCLNEV